jgi:hypothetical protein
LGCLRRASRHRESVVEAATELDVRDTSFNGTPLGWALHGWWERRDRPAEQAPYYEIVALLVAAGAPVDEIWLRPDNASADTRMFAALTG